MEQVKISKVSEYIKYIEDTTDHYRRSLKLLFRGESKSDYDLLPSIYRKIKTDELVVPETGEIKHICNDLYLNSTHERDIINDFMYEAASRISTISTSDFNDRVQWLTYAQHFGVPTRLLDWTYNPLVALYFACKSNDGDGKVYILRVNHYNQITTSQNAVYADGRTIKEYISDAIWKNTKCFPYPILVHPYYFDQRMSAQSSCFMVWGENQSPLTKIISDLEKEKLGSMLYEEKSDDNTYHLIEKEDTSLLSVYIPNENKLNILRELDILNINPSTVFPGLDGIGQTIEWRNRLHIRDMDAIL